MSKPIIQKAVDQYLDEIEYDFVGYVPEEEALAFVSFIQDMNAGSEENETPLVHLKMMDTVFNKKRRVAVLCHRGIGKTALFAEYLILFIAAYGYMPGFGKIDLMLYISDSIENGVKNLRRNVEFRYANSEFLQKLIPNIKLTIGDNRVGDPTKNRVDLEDYEKEVSGGRKFTDIRLEFENYRGDKLVVKGYGAKTGVRGAKEMGQRPTLAVFDDIVSDTDAESPTIIGTIENTVYKAVSKALHPTRQKMVWLGTPFNESDPLYKAVESGAWEVACFPIAEDFDSKTTIDNFKGSWEERFTFEYVKAEFDEAMLTGRPQDFYQELMLRISSEEERLIPESNIVMYNRDDVIKNQQDFNFYIMTDAATSENKKADYSVITIWAVNNNGDVLLIDGWHDRVLFNKFLDKLFEFTSIYNTNLMGVGIETSATQKGFISVIIDKQIRENRYFPLLSNGTEPGLKPVGDKFQRFLAVQPKFAAHKIWFPRELKNTPFMVELLNELKGVSRTNTNPKKLGKARHDDVLDTISQLGMVELIIPSVGPTVNPKREEEGIWYNDAEEDEEYFDSYSM